MKVLVICVLAVLAFSQLHAVSLKDALGMPEAHELDVVENGIVDIIKEKIKTFLDSLKDIAGKLGESGQKILAGLLEVAKTFKLHLGETIKKVLASLKDKIDFQPLKDLINKLLGKSDESGSSAPANGLEEDQEIVEHIMKIILEEVTSDESLERFRDIIEHVAEDTKLEFIHGLRAFLHKIDNSELRQWIKALLSDTRVEKRGIAEIFERIKEIIKAVGSQFAITAKPLFDWIVDKWNQLKAFLSSKVGIIKAIGLELFKHGSTISKAVAEEAKKFLSKYKDILGSLFKPLMDKLTGRITATTPASI